MTAGKGCDALGVARIAGNGQAVARARERARVRVAGGQQSGRLAGGDYQRGSKARGIGKGDVPGAVNVLSRHSKNLGWVNIQLFMG